MTPTNQPPQDSTIDGQIAGGQGGEEETQEERDEADWVAFALGEAIIEITAELGEAIIEITAELALDKANERIAQLEADLQKERDERLQTNKRIQGQRAELRRLNAEVRELRADDTRWECAAQVLFKRLVDSGLPWQEVWALTVKARWTDPVADMGRQRDDAIERSQGWESQAIFFREANEKNLAAGELLVELLRTALLHFQERYRLMHRRAQRAERLYGESEIGTVKAERDRAWKNLREAWKEVESANKERDRGTKALELATETKGWFERFFIAAKYEGLYRLACESRDLWRSRSESGSQAHNELYKQYIQLTTDPEGYLKTHLSQTEQYWKKKAEKLELLQDSWAKTVKATEDKSAVLRQENNALRTENRKLKSASFPTGSQEGK